MLRTEDPTALACSSRASGIRVFDIRDLGRVRKIAYFNPGGDEGGDGAGESTAQVHLDPVRGELWSTHGDKGFFVTRFTNGAWPFKAPGPRPRR